MSMQFEKAYLFMIKKLEKELPSWLSYHNVQHTKDVVEAVQHLCKSENVTERECLLLSTAAAFHDAGFVEEYDDHEEHSCKIARACLPQFNYRNDEIEIICELIMVTKPPQLPKNLLEQILCDADLLYLGTEKYHQIAEELFKEFSYKGIVRDRYEWDERQKQFLKTHRYFTKTAALEYNKKKEENLKQFVTSVANKEPLS